MKWAKVYLSSHFIKVRLVPEMGIDIPDGFFDPFIVCHVTKLSKLCTGKTRFLLIVTVGFI